MAETNYFKGFLMNGKTLLSKYDNFMLNEKNIEVTSLVIAFLGTLALLILLILGF